MTITVNGESSCLQDGLTVAGLLVELNIKTDRVAVELNRDIVPRTSFDQQTLSDGDSVEVVTLVGGG